MEYSTKLVSIIARIGTICKMPFNEVNLQKLTNNFIVSNSKIKKVLDVKFPVSTVLGLETTIKSFQKNKKNG